MISTQKVTSLAFSVHDGLYKEKKDLNPDQNKQAVRYAHSTFTFACSSRSISNRSWIHVTYPLEMQAVILRIVPKCSKQTFWFFYVHVTFTL